MRREDFWEHVDKSGECWLWTGATNGDAGYGLFHLDGEGMRYAHRLAYTECVGPIPEGFDIDHLCRNHGCVNPSHLEAVTHRENMLRGARARQVACLHGHPYEAANTYRTKAGHRRCRRCRADDAIRRRAAAKTAVAA